MGEYITLIAEWIVVVYSMSVLVVLGVTLTIKVQGRLLGVPWTVTILGAIIWPITLLISKK